VEKLRYIHRNPVIQISGPPAVPIKRSIVKNLAYCLLPFIALMTVSRSLQAAAPRQHEQTVFGTDDSPVERPVSVPSNAIKILAKDPDVSHELSSHHLPPGKIPSDWSVASEVHLSTSKAPDDVVIARSFLAGANVTTFWIFMSTAHGLDLVLKVRAQTLTITPPRVDGRLSIEAAALIGGRVAKRLYKFDGSRYVGPKE